MNSTALIVVDLQVDFCSPQGVAARQGKKMSEIYAVLPRVAEFYKAAKIRNIPVFFTQFIYHSVKAPVTMKRHVSAGFSPMCVSGSRGEILYPIEPSVDDMIVQKFHYDPFAGTDFLNQLKRKKIEHVLISGVRTELCVDITAKRAVSEGFEVTIAEDLVATFDDKYLLHDAFLQLFGKYYGRVKRSKTILKELYSV